MNRFKRFSPVLVLFVASALIIPVSGCRSTSAPASDDAALASSLVTRLSDDPAINTLPIQSSVQGGVATLTGSVVNDAQRTIAARDAAGIPGIRSVINDLQVGSAPTVASALHSPQQEPPPLSATVSSHRPAPLPLVQPRRPSPTTARPQPQRPSPIEHAYNTPSPSGYQAPVQQQQVPPQPPQPAFRNVTIPTGTTLPVRITQTLDSASTQIGESFTGVTTTDIVLDGVTAIPAGSSVSGRVDAVQEAGHFKGNSLLSISLTGVRTRGASLSLTSDPYSVEGNGRGKNTAVKTGGGAAVGAILGGIFGGGKGAAIGAVTGGGLGAGSNAVTRGQQVQITSESVVRFHTGNPVTVRVRTDGVEARDSDLQRRSNNQ